VRLILFFLKRLPKRVRGIDAEDGQLKLRQKIGPRVENVARVRQTVRDS